MLSWQHNNSVVMATESMTLLYRDLSHQITQLAKFLLRFRCNRSYLGSVTV